jgi:hypothetical protein
MAMSIKRIPAGFVHPGPAGLASKPPVGADLFTKSNMMDTE